MSRKFHLETKLATGFESCPSLVAPPIVFGKDTPLLVSYKISERTHCRPKTSIGIEYLLHIALGTDVRSWVFSLIICGDLHEVLGTAVRCQCMKKPSCQISGRFGSDSGTGCA